MSKTKQELLDEATAQGLNVNEEMTVVEIQAALDEAAQNQPDASAGGSDASSDSTAPAADKAPTGTQPRSANQSGSPSSDPRLVNTTPIDLNSSDAVVNKPEDGNR